MKIFKSKIFYFFLGLFLAAAIPGVYAWNSTVSSGDPLTADSWNALVNKIENLDSDVDGLATEGYVDSSVDSFESCNWDGWQPQQSVTSPTECVCSCRAAGYYTQLYCSDGKITDTRTVSYCANCDDSTCVACFVSGTQVLMADREVKDIEKIESGDFVINEKGHPDKVIELREHQVGTRNTYVINNKIETTPEHPFMTKEGWKVISLERLEFTKEVSDYYQNIEADELREGDVLLTLEGKEVIESIEEKSERPFEETVYTLILEHGEAFYAEGYLVADGM